MAIGASGGYLVPMESIAPPRPTWFQSISATLVMLVCSGVISFALTFIAEDLRAFLPAYIVLALALLVLNVQYFAMFCFSRPCTTFMLWVLGIAFVASCCWLLASIQLVERAGIILVLIPITILALLSLILGLGFRANWYWRRTLTVAIEQGTPPQRQASFSLLEMMTGTLLFAIMIGPVCYKLGAEFPVYREDLSPDQVPFPISESAQQITYRQEYDSTIRAIWHQNPADLQRWLGTMKTQEDVDNFLLYKQPLQDVEIRIPQPPSMYGRRFLVETLPHGYQAQWDHADRRAYLKWDVATENGMTTVYYFELPLGRAFRFSP